MYRPVGGSGDAVSVPRLLFSRLCAQGADDARFRVALYIFGEGGAQAEAVAEALRLPRAQVDAALHYWEGAGLVERDAPATPCGGEPRKRRRMTTREVLRAGEADPVLGMLMSELQKVFGRVLGEGETNALITLYAADNFAADLILMAAAEAAARGADRAAYVEKILGAWRREGIEDCAAADRHLKLAAEREQRLRRLADMLGLAWDPFTLADKKKVSLWFEEYGYGWEMVETARMVAGERGRDVKYMAGILKSWHGKGYTSPRDVRQGEEGRNLRAAGPARTRPEGDLLTNMSGYTPLRQRRRP